MGAFHVTSWEPPSVTRGPFARPRIWTTAACRQDLRISNIHSPDIAPVHIRIVKSVYLRLRTFFLLYRKKNQVAMSVELTSPPVAGATTLPLGIMAVALREPGGLASPLRIQAQVATLFFFLV